MTNRPVSATIVWTGLVGLAAGTAAIFALHGWEQAGHLKTLAVILAATVPMVAIEVLVRKVHQAPTSGLAARPVNPLNLARIGQKLVGFWLTLCVIAAAYWLMPEYAGDYYEPFRQAVVFVLPGLVILSPIYIWYVDRRQVEPEDSYVEVFRLAFGRKPPHWDGLRNFAVSWLVKGFFLPLMFIFLNDSLRDVWSRPAIPSFADYGQFYEYFYTLFFLWDVLLAALGYMMTLRLLDSHIRSAEPTMLGWVVCLACYPPFWSLIGSNYFAYENDDLYWGHFFASMPALYITWATLILLLVGVYVWATTMFGIRFSNLTHRGIITAGPYRWVKHPAYLSKNISWWLISVPFLTTTGPVQALQASLLLLGVNFIYYMRAVTEERHLARDPVYRAYQAYMAEHGLGAILRRRLGLGKPATASETPPAE